MGRQQVQQHMGIQAAAVADDQMASVGMGGEQWIQNGRGKRSYSHHGVSSSRRWSIGRPTNPRHDIQHQIPFLAGNLIEYRSILKCSQCQD